MNKPTEGNCSDQTNQRNAISVVTMVYSMNFSV